MSCRDLTSHLVTKEVKSLKDFEGLLVELGRLDADYCGDNGEDYLSDEAKAAGYDSDAEYDAHSLVDKITRADVRKGVEGAEELIQRYLDGWLGEDGYYHEYEAIVRKADGSDGFYGIYAVSVAATVG